MKLSSSTCERCRQCCQLPLFSEYIHRQNQDGRGRLMPLSQTPWKHLPPALPLQLELTQQQHEQELEV
jgi:hypothetical protein